MTAPAWYRRRAPRAPLDTGRMYAAGGLIESPFRWCEPMLAPRRADWMPWAAGRRSRAALLFILAHCVIDGGKS